MSHDVESQNASEDVVLQEVLDLPSLETTSDVEEISVENSQEVEEVVQIAQEFIESVEALLRDNPSSELQKLSDEMHGTITEAQQAHKNWLHAIDGFLGITEKGRERKKEKAWSIPDNPKVIKDLEQKFRTWKKEFSALRSTSAKKETQERLFAESKDLMRTYNAASKRDNSKWRNIRYSIDSTLATCVEFFLSENKLEEAIDYWNLAPDNEGTLAIAEDIIRQVESNFVQNNSLSSFLRTHTDVPYDKREEMWRENQSKYFQEQLQACPDLLALYSCGEGLTNPHMRPLAERKQYFVQVLKMPRRQGVLAKFDTAVLEDETSEISHEKKQALFDAYRIFSPEKIFLNSKIFEHEIDALKTQERDELIQKLISSIDGTNFYRQYNLVESFLEHIAITEQEYALLENAFQKGASWQEGYTLSQHLEKKAPLGILRNAEVLQKQGVDIADVRAKQFSVSFAIKPQHQTDVAFELVGRTKNIVALLQQGEKYGCSKEMLKELLFQWVQESAEDKTVMTHEPQRIEYILQLAKEVGVISSEEAQRFFLHYVQSADAATLRRLSHHSDPEIRMVAVDRLIEQVPFYDAYNLFLQYESGQYVYTESQVSALLHKVIDGYSGFYSLRVLFERHFLDASSQKLTVVDAQTVLQKMCQVDFSNTRKYLSDYRQDGKLTEEQYQEFRQALGPFLKIYDLDALYSNPDDELFTNEKTASIVYMRLLSETVVHLENLLDRYFVGELPLTRDQFAQAQKKFAEKVTNAFQLKAYLEFATSQQCESLVDDLISADNQIVLLDFVRRDVASKLSPQLVEKIATYLLEHADNHTLGILIEDFIILFPGRSEKEKSIFTSPQQEKLFEKAIQIGNGDVLFALLSGSQKPSMGPRGEWLPPLDLEDARLEEITEALLERAEPSILVQFIRGFPTQNEYLQDAKSRAIDRLIFHGDIDKMAQVLSDSLEGSMQSLSLEQKEKIFDTIIEKGTLDEKIWLSKRLVAYNEDRSKIEKLSDSIIESLLQKKDGINIFRWYNVVTSAITQDQFNRILEYVFLSDNAFSFLCIAHISSSESGQAVHDISSEQYGLLCKNMRVYEPRVFKVLQEISDEFDTYLLEYLQDTSILAISRFQKVMKSEVTLGEQARREISKLIDTLFFEGSFEDLKFVFDTKGDLVKERLNQFDITTLDEERKYTFLQYCSDLKVLRSDWYHEYWNISETKSSSTREAQIAIASLWGNIMYANQYEWFDSLGAEIHREDGEVQKPSEFFKNFVDTYPVGNKGKTILTLVATAEYERGLSPKDCVESVAKQIREYTRILERGSSERVPKGLRASIGLEYEITHSNGDGYRELHPGSDLKKDILKLSAAAGIGQGNDALHEIAGKPSDNPYLVLLEMKLLQDLGFINFNFDRPKFEQGSHGYHVTIGGEKGIITNTNSNFLQNVLVLSGWGGVNTGTDLFSLSRGRGVNIRQRERNNMILFEGQTHSVEFRCLSVDQWEPFERSILTAHNGAIAIQAVEQYVDAQASKNLIFSERFPESVDDMLEELALIDAIDLDKLDEPTSEIIFEWLSLMHEVVHSLQDHNEKFWDNETSGYLNDNGEWVDGQEFGAQNNKVRFEQVVKEIDPHMSAQEYLARQQILPEAMMEPTSADWVNTVTHITNLFLKPSKESGGDSVNALAMLQTTKLGNDRLEDSYISRAKDSVFDTQGKTREGYYNLQGGSERLVVHAVQKRLLNFNKRMGQICSTPQKQLRELPPEELALAS